MNIPKNLGETNRAIRQIEIDYRIGRITRATYDFHWYSLRRMRDHFEVTASR